MSAHSARRALETNTPEANALTAVGLSLVAGYTDGYGLRHLRTFVSFISGNTTTAATLVGTGTAILALFSLLAVCGFFVGSFAGNWIATSSLGRPRRVILLASALLLLVHTALFTHAFPGTDVLLLSVAMALLNPSIRRIGTEAVNVTFVTGTVSKAAAHLVLALRGQHPEEEHLRRAGFEALLWASLFAGAVISVPAQELKSLTLLPACAALCALAAMSSD